MRRAILCFAAILCIPALPAGAQLYVHCNQSASDFEIDNSGDATYYSQTIFSFDIDFNASVALTLHLGNSETGSYNDKDASGMGTCSTTSGQIPQPGFDTLDSGCYRSTTSGFASENSVSLGTQTASSSQYCIADPPPPPPLGDQCGDNGWVGQCSPIVINFASGGYELTGANSPVLFDMSGSGTKIKMGWTAAGANEAFLWLDRNHNGKVTSGQELFGNFTPLKDGQLAKNGFEALREYDDNHDGVIDENDAVWGRLMLWRDLNHNGISEPNEISPLARSGVTQISLADHFTGRVDAFGNAFKYESTVTLGSGGLRPRPRPVYDIFFIRVP